MHSIRIIGPGRAGTSLAAALSAHGWAFAGFLGRHDDLADAAARRRRAGHRHARRRRRRGGGGASSPSPAPRWCTSRARSGSMPWRPTRSVPLSTRSCRCPTARSGRPASPRGSPSPSPASRSPGEMVAMPGRPAWSKWPTRTAPPTTRPPASPPTTSWRCWARSSGWPPRSGSTSTSFLPLTRAAVDDVASLGAARRADRAGAPRRLGHPEPPPRCAARGRARRLPGRRGAGDEARPGSGAQTVTPGEAVPTDETVPAVPAAV